MTYASEVLADAPLAFYTLDETSGTTLTDASGNGHDGIYSTTPNTAPSIAVDGTASVYFAGDNYGFVTAASWQMCPNFSVEAWFNAYYVNSYRCIVGRDWSSPRSFNVYVRDGLMWVDLPGAVVSFYGATTIDTGTDYHVALTYDGTTARLYVNGALDGSATVTGTNNVAGIPLWIGATAAGIGASYFHFDGRIDDVAYYDYELSATRVGDHYTAGAYVYTPGPYATEVLADTPTGYWPLNETAGATAIDRSGNFHHATLGGGALVRDQPPVNDEGGSIHFYGGHAEIAQASWMETTSLTVEAWINPDDAPGNYAIATRDQLTGSNANRAFNLQIYQSRLRGRVWPAAGGGDSEIFLSDVDTIVTGNNYHVVMTYDGATQTLKAYVNGVETYTNVMGFALNTTSDTRFRIAGPDPSVYGEVIKFEGRLAHVALYDYALTGARISDHFDAGELTDFTGGMGLDGDGILTLDGPQIFEGQTDLDSDGTLTLDGVASIPVDGLAGILVTCLGMVQFDPPVIDPVDADYDPEKIGPPGRLHRVPDYTIHVERG